MSRLAELCTKLQTTRDDMRKMNERIDALVRARCEAESKEAELLATLAKELRSDSGTMVHEAVQVGTQVALISMVDGDATVRFMELK